MERDCFCQESAGRVSERERTPVRVCRFAMLWEILPGHGVLSCYMARHTTVLGDDCVMNDEKKIGGTAQGVLPGSPSDHTLEERFVFREIFPDEADQAAGIEAVCFPPNEACTRDIMRERVAAAPELFLVAVEKKSGRIAGFLNGFSTDEETFRDAFFTDAGLHDPAGKM